MEAKAAHIPTEDREGVIALIWIAEFHVLIVKAIGENVDRFHTEIRDPCCLVNTHW